MIFFAGADGFLIGNYLTRTGLDPKDDHAMLAGLGLTISAP
jgi:biotin synthase-like enzyme